MKESISPKVAGIIIAVAVVLVALIGWKLVAEPKGSASKPPPEAQKWMHPGSGMSEHYTPAGGPPRGYQQGSPPANNP